MTVGDKDIPVVLVIFFIIFSICFFSVSVFFYIKSIKKIMSYNKDKEEKDKKEENDNCD